MSSTRAKKRSGRPSRDIYAEVTGRILAALERGVVPWRRPWRVARHTDSDRYTHLNVASKKRYRGVNTLLLDLTAATEGYTSPYWVTFGQAIALGGAVRRGETSTMIVFWKQLLLPSDDDDEQRPRRIPLLRHYNVFNTEQCDGLDERIPPPPAPEAFAPLEAARSLLAKMPDPPRVIHGGSRAYYRPATDTVGLPQPECFESPEAYYATSYHEHVHATGHRRRLARKEIMQISEFAGPGYSREELVAEMGAAFLCAIADIAVPSLVINTAAYIASWTSKLREDPKLLVLAASQAQRACDFILAAEPALAADTGQSTPVALAPERAAAKGAAGAARAQPCDTGRGDARPPTRRVRKEAMPQTGTDPTAPPRRFAHLSIAQLRARMNRASDFGYDDEEEELALRLKDTGRTWRWTESDPPRVEIYTPKGTRTEKAA